MMHLSVSLSRLALSGIVAAQVFVAGCKTRSFESDTSQGTATRRDGRCPEQYAKPRSVPVSIVSVGDGDTIKVKPLGKDAGKDVWTVRMFGIDAPETDHGKGGQEPWATQSANALASLLPADLHVTLQSHGRDPFCRHLGRILIDRSEQHGHNLDPLDVNREMITQGHAFPFPFCRGGDACTRTDLESRGHFDDMRACDDARQRNAGVHDGQRPLLESPFEFRMRAWGDSEVAFIGNLRTGEFVSYADRGKVPACEQVVFAVGKGTDRADVVQGHKDHPSKFGFKEMNN